jgi:hypothetical protein
MAYKDEAGLTWKEFSSELFECEYCAECGGDAEDHIPTIGPFGLWFAMCKCTPIVDGVYFRHDKMRKAAA